MSSKKKAVNVHVPKLKTVTLTATLLGMSGLYCHRMSAKAKRELLIGGRKKTAADKLKLKHHPREEFRDSMHVMPGLFPDTDVVFPAMAIKQAMATAALSVPGLYKTDVQRMVYIPAEWIPIYGIPLLRMDVVRMANQARTPDIRTRAYFSTWGTELDIQFASPGFTKTAIASLLGNAGIVAGIGDNRQEKGNGAFGTFELVNTLPSELRDIDRQREAIETPLLANEETAELMAVFDAEVADRDIG